MEKRENKINLPIRGEKFSKITLFHIADRASSVKLQAIRPEVTEVYGIPVAHESWLLPKTKRKSSQKVW